MGDLRIIKHDLIYVIGLSERLANEETLKNKDYMGQYGTIKKIIVNKDKPFNKGVRDSLSFSAYITFSCEIEAAVAIAAVDGKELDNRTLKASFGLSKYCMSYVKNSKCSTKGCPYVHKAAKECDTFTKEEANSVEVLQKIHNHGAFDLLARSNSQFTQLYRNRKEGLKFPTYKDVEKALKEHIINNPVDQSKKASDDKSTNGGQDALKDESNKLISKWGWGEETEVIDFDKISTEIIEESPKPIIEETSLIHSLRKPQTSQPLLDMLKSSNIASIISSPKSEERQFNNFSPISLARGSPFAEDSLDIFKLKKNSLDTSYSDRDTPSSPTCTQFSLKDRINSLSTLDTTILSNGSHSKSFENQIENSITQKPHEYTDLDKQILAQLNKSYVERSERQRRQQGSLGVNFLQEDSQNEHSQPDSLRRLIDMFLQPNDKIFKNMKLSKDNDEPARQSRLFSKFMIKKMVEGDSS